MKSLVIGANSFIGHYLAKCIHANGEQVIEADIVNSVSFLSGSSKRVVDITDKKSIKKLLEEERPQNIYCLTSVDSISYAWEYPNEVLEQHIKGILNLLDIIREAVPDANVLLVGSGDEYGFVGYENLPIKEVQVTNPQNIYAVSKCCQNMIAQLYARAYKMNVVIARAFNDVGPGQSDRFVLSSICKQVVQIQKKLIPPVVFAGNVNITRDFIDVRDTVEAFHSLINKGEKSQIYNVGTGKGISIISLINIIKQVENIDFEIVVDEKLMRPNDIPIIVADITKIRESVGWFPKIPIEKTVRDIVSYWQSTI